MTQAVSGLGTIFQKWNGSGWSVISEITAIKGPGLKRDQIEVTSLDSTDGYREFITGFREAGTLSLTMNFTRGNFDILLADFESDVEQNYEIVLPDAVNTSLEFIGLVLEMPLNITTKDAISQDVSILITGKVTVNSGSYSGSPA